MPGAPAGPLAVADTPAGAEPSREADPIAVDVEPFPAFLARTASARLVDFPGAACSPAEFRRMRTYILELYRDVEVACTFADPSGHPIDCVPFGQHPSVRAARASGHEVQTTPPPPALPAGIEPAPPEAHRARPCPEGTVPLRRTTLEELTRFRTLKGSFRKSPPPRLT